MIIVFDVAGGIPLPTSDVTSAGGTPAVNPVEAVPVNAPQHMAISDANSNAPITPILTPIAIFPPVDSPDFFWHWNPTVVHSYPLKHRQVVSFTNPFVKGIF